LKDEREIISAIRAGSLDDFGELVRLHQRRVFAIVSRYERDPQRAEDLAQQTFIKAWRALDKYDGRAPFEHWISRIAVRTALDYLRKQKRLRREVPFSSLGDSVLDWLGGDQDSDRADLEGARELLGAALSRLSAEDQLVITLMEIEQRSVKEISGLTGWSGIAVRVRAHRARARLKKVFERMSHEGRKAEQAV
jgi:RNA polymerase sigma-70 factor (ECF subfamily)